MALVSLFIFLLLTNLAVLLSAQDYKEYKQCEPFSCNLKIGNLSFPFRKREGDPKCGLFSVDCAQGFRRIQLKEGGKWHDFTSIDNSSNIISMIIDEDLQERLENNSCDDENLRDLSLVIPSLPYVSIIQNQTLLNCSRPLSKTFYEDLKPVNCSSAMHRYYYNMVNSVPPSPECSAVELPLLKGWNLSSQPFSNFISLEFSIQVTVSEKCLECFAGGNSCRVYEEEQEATCSTAPSPIPRPAPSTPPAQPTQNGRKTKSQLKLLLGLGLGVPTFLAACLFIFWCYRKRSASNKMVSSGAAGLVIVLVAVCCYKMKMSDKSTFFRMNTNHSEELVKGFMKDHGPLQVKRYRYLDVKKMTNSFKEKLGQGGYGGVYKGKLKEGCLVAVKILNRSKGNGEDFMNEVAAISRTSHVNIVSLLGFCFEGSKRALIYEFMPNGSLEKFIFDANKLKKDDHLGWEALEKISIGIARGLEYLHRGCNTRILHFDIKPHNILLNEDFLPKIADFGLAKICYGKESIVSMTGARGTAGYIAPEVFCRNFGGVSHKSDVYSYGMMLSKMTGGRRNINAEAENSSEIYFPQWIYKRLELDEDLGMENIKNEEDKMRARKMIIVSLWCIQTNPSSRPSMKQVIEMLEGSVELEIPPKPYLSSPPKSPAHSSSTVTSAFSILE